MIDEEKDIELAELYLQHRMTDEEASAFEKRLKKEPYLENLVEMLRKVISELKNDDSRQLKRQLENKEKELSSHKSVKKPFYHAGLRIAAGFIVLLGLFSLCYYAFFNTGENPEKLALKYKPVEPGLPVLMDNTSKKDKSEAMNIFRSDNFEKAGEMYGRLLEKDPYNDTLLYFKAICDFEQNEYTGSETNLNKLLLYTTSVWRDKGGWWLALAMIAQDRKEEARQLLLQIQSNKWNEFSGKASELLREKYFSGDSASEREN
jgi:hypothetical protein